MTDSARTAASLEIRDRFDSAPAAAKYARSLAGTRTHDREARCVRAALDDLAPGSRVLDLPCGTGRLVPLLLESGFTVTAADSSSHMVREARAALEQPLKEGADIDFVVADAFSTPFDDGEFDAVVCNRLLHHLPDSSDRRAVLAELSRICRGSIVVSFFNSMTWDGMTFHIRDRLTGRKAFDRIPIRRTSFERDANAAGLRVIEWHATRPWISKQTYAECIPGPTDTALTDPIQEP